MRMALQQTAAVSAPAARRPPIQMKTRISPINDPLEREADRIADAVVSGTPIGAIGGAPPGTAQHKCAGCEAEERREAVRRKTDGAVAATSVRQPSTAQAEAAISSGGMPLSPRERAYFEPRFGHDLSGLRVHTGDEAASAASSINARAYALGGNIAFARGEYRPDTAAGKHLIAHEVAHTLQQSAALTPIIRRATYGSGAPPVWNSVTLGPAPQDEREHIDEAIAKIDEVVADPSTFAECHRQYAERCPNGNSGTLSALWNRISIWRITSADPGVYARALTGGSDIGYNPLAYNQGTLGLAATLMHEAGHCCGIPGGATHWHADLVSNYCMGPDSSNAISLGGGPSLSGGSPLLLFSYRRFLGDWAGGRLRATLGFDLNSISIGAELGSRAQPPGQRPTGDFGSAMFGFQARAGGWGGTRYGGFTFRIETGFGAGRFSLRPATPAEAPSTSVAPSWILQVGPRAEFLINIGGGRALPLSIGAAYRLAQPLNAEAETLHGIVGTIEIRP